MASPLSKVKAKGAPRDAQEELGGQQKGFSKEIFGLRLGGVGTSQMKMGRDGQEGGRAVQAEAVESIAHLSCDIGSFSADS